MSASAGISAIGFISIYDFENFCKIILNLKSKTKNKSEIMRFEMTKQLCVKMGK